MDPVEGGLPHASGQAHEQSRKIAYVPADEDIQTVVDQAGVSKEKAVKALEETNGDIAEAILKLSE